MKPKELQKLVAVLQKKFDAEVRHEKIDGKGRYRLEVVSPKFKKLKHLDRQDLVWAVVDQILPRALTLDISIILTYSPADLAPAH